ncbi:hypothetical protein [Nocardia sp. NPDC056564]
MPEPKGQLTLHTNGSADDLIELLEWFNEDDDLRGRVELPSNGIRQGQMGDLYDVLVVALGAGGIASALARSLTSWFTVRGSDIAITLKIDGHTELTLDAKRIKAPEVAQTLQNMLQRPRDPQ